MKPFVKVAAVGITGVALFSLAGPLFGMLLGLMFTTVKWALIAAVGYFVYTLFFKKGDAEVEIEEEIQDVEVVLDE